MNYFYAPHQFSRCFVTWVLFTTFILILTLLLDYHQPYFAFSLVRSDNFAWNVWCKICPHWLCVGWIVIFSSRDWKGGQTFCHLFLSQANEPSSSSIVSHDMGRLAYFAVVVALNLRHGRQGWFSHEFGKSREKNALSSFVFTGSYKLHYSNMWTEWLWHCMRDWRY